MVTAPMLDGSLCMQCKQYLAKDKLSMKEHNTVGSTWRLSDEKIAASKARHASSNMTASSLASGCSCRRFLKALSYTLQGHTPRSSIGAHLSSVSFDCKVTRDVTVSQSNLSKEYLSPKAQSQQIFHKDSWQPSYAQTNVLTDAVPACAMIKQPRKERQCRDKVVWVQTTDKSHLHQLGTMRSNTPASVCFPISCSSRAFLLSSSLQPVGLT